MKKRTAKAHPGIAITVLALMACQPLAAQAGRITMSNPDEQELKGGKRLCVYSNSVYTFSFITRSTSCPHTKTFNTEVVY